MANTLCTIEMEPRTLNQGQLNNAREVAAGVVHKMEPEEASIVFIEGLRPVVPLQEMIVMEEKIVEEEEELVVVLERQDIVVEKVDRKDQIEIRPACRCLCGTTLANNVGVESHSPPDQVSLIREPLSAPF